jgi:SAM-dependent methyltransferase
MAVNPVSPISTGLAAAIEARRHWDVRYAEGVTPWDTQITPPEVEAFWTSGRLPPQGLALDLGCGPGTNVRYLARMGLHAVGVEIAGAPLLTAGRRTLDDPLAQRLRMTFCCADVCALPFQGIQAAYILDIGCLHNLSPQLRFDYAAGVIANLAPGGYYHLYAFDANPHPEDEPESKTTGLADGEVEQLFTPALHLVEEIRARPDRRPCRWYLLQRPATSD